MALYLLDTHTVMWWWRGSPRLGPMAREAIGRPDVDIRVSAISALEIAIKHRIGKFDDIGDPAANYSRLMAENGFVSLPVTEDHAMNAGLLPGNHLDPFDRLIAAQALIEGLTVITRDPALAAFGCEVIW